jgi:hypothetical protein
LYSSRKPKDFIETELSLYLSNWQYLIIKRIIDDFYENYNIKNDYKYVCYSLTELFKNINLYIYYYVCEQNVEWLKGTIYKIYDECDIIGIKKLYQYYIQAYLNIDHVFKIENCHNGFLGIHKLIQSKCNSLKIDNYEILSVLQNYIKIEEMNNKEVHIKKRYKEYTDRVFYRLFELLKEKKLIDYKEQHKRCVRLLEIFCCNEIPKYTYFLERLGLSCLYNLKYACCCKENIKLNFVYLYLSLYISKKEYVIGKLLRYDIKLVNKYFDVLLDISSKLTAYNITDTMRSLIVFEDGLINSF